MKRFLSLRHVALVLFSLFFITASIDSKNSDDRYDPPDRLIKRQLSVKSLVDLSDDSPINRIIIKFKENSDIRLLNGKFQSVNNIALDDINNTLENYPANTASSLFPKFEKNDNLKALLELRSGYQLADMGLYYSLDITDPIIAEQIINRLNASDNIEIAYAEPIAVPAEDVDPPTPDYIPFQFYRTAAPDGVDADYANTQSGGDGAGVKIIDVENSWNESHEDLDNAVGGTLNGGNQQDGHHGTAVIGVMISGDNGYGTAGICYGADIGMASAAVNGTPEAILMAVEDLDPGDLILIELHSPGPRYDFQVRSDQLGYICMEYWQANFDAMFYAWAKGIIVCEAAGNGAEDFDDPIYENYFDTTFRNSHAIIIGAGAPISGASGTPRSRLDFSNYGERVNLQGYGREVFTTGYGGYWDGDGDMNQYYTSTFSGTSSASPIVTGAVACLQGYYKATYGVPLTADYAREILASTGSPQQGDTSEHIGPLPNLLSAFGSLNAPPSLYVDPILIDTTIESGNQILLSGWIHNRSATTTIDFEIIENQYLHNPDSIDWLTYTVTGSSIAPADSLLIDIDLDATMAAGSFSPIKGILQFNWGPNGGTLDSTTYLPVFMDVPCVADITYEAFADDDPGGQAYNWIDIKTVGDLVPQSSFYNPYASDPLDDGSAGPFLLPFDFQYFGETYDRFYIGVNGGISFTDMNVNSGGYYNPYSIPGDYDFTTFIPVFWNDLLIGTTHGAHGDIYTYFTADTAIVEWWQIGSWDLVDDTLNTFELILTSDGNITMQYQDVGSAGHENTTLIGLAEIECTYLSYFNHGEPVEKTVGPGSRIDFIRQIIPEQAGDPNGDGAINILDITYLIDYLYNMGPAPDPLGEGDVNCNGATNILDITYLIAYLYQSGPEPCYF